MNFQLPAKLQTNNRPVWNNTPSWYIMCMCCSRVTRVNIDLCFSLEMSTKVDFDHNCVWIRRNQYKLIKTNIAVFLCVSKYIYFAFVFLFICICFQFFAHFLRCKESSVCWCSSTICYTEYSLQTFSCLTKINLNLWKVWQTTFLVRE